MTREECLANAARVFATGIAQTMTGTPREVAEAAHYAGGPSVDELEQQVIARRAVQQGAAA